MSPAIIVSVIIALVIWIYLLTVLNRADNRALFFILGSGGLFSFLMIFIRPVLTMPLARVVALIAGGIGRLTGLFSSYFRYGVIFIATSKGRVSLMIDMECSGILEIMAFISLLMFFRIYSMKEKIIVSLTGSVLLILFNAIRVIVISLIIHFFGTGSFFVAHTVVGRLIFYGLSVILYFIVFTKAQIIRQKVGVFRYGNNKRNS